VTLIGYTMMCEQAGQKQLVRDVALAEEAGFDFAVIGDHYSPAGRTGPFTLCVERLS
jgi:alkanesulfonate monooxygenase SsuD/methylene tetrahydromethanopterin reductase-like flavin-dependent oxidoreductase (luciferase family)